MAGKTFPAIPAHAQPAILHIWQEAHVSFIGVNEVSWIEISTARNCWSHTKNQQESLYFMITACHRNGFHITGPLLDDAYKGPMSFDVFILTLLAWLSCWTIRWVADNLWCQDPDVTSGWYSRIGLWLYLLSIYTCAVNWNLAMNVSGSSLICIYIYIYICVFLNKSYDGGGGGSQSLRPSVSRYDVIWYLPW